MEAERGRGRGGGRERERVSAAAFDAAAALVGSAIEHHITPAMKPLRMLLREDSSCNLREVKVDQHHGDEPRIHSTEQHIYSAPAVNLSSCNAIYSSIHGGSVNESRSGSALMLDNISAHAPSDPQLSRTRTAAAASNCNYDYMGAVSGTPQHASIEQQQYSNYNVQHPQGFGSFSSGSLTGAGYALEGLRFISKASGRRDKRQWWEAVERRFHKLASPLDGTLSRECFAACIGMEDSAAFAVELFDALARRKGEEHTVKSITLDGLRDYWCQITDDSFHSRAQIFFDLCDKDSDGRIAEEEVKEMIMLSASSNKLSILEEQAEEYASLIMQQLDEDNLGYIEVCHLETLFRAAARGAYGWDSSSRRGDQKNNDHNGTAATTNNNSNSSNGLLLSNAPAAAYLPLGARGSRPRSRTRGAVRLVQRMARGAYYRVVEEHWQRAWVVSWWLAAVAGLFTWKFLQYKRRADFQIMGYCVCTAKGAAETLKLNMALVLLPVCRNSMTWLRSTVLGSIVPFHDNINFHKMIGVAIGLGVAMHAGSHLGCDFPRIAAANHAKFTATIARDFGNTQPSVWEIMMTLEVMSGAVMVLLMGVAYLLANHRFRRNLVKLPWPLHRLTGFNAFWYSHHLFFLVYAILIVHSIFLFLTHDWTQKTTWIYIAVPMVLYACERLLRIFRARQYKVSTVKAAIYAGDVLALYMTKPPGFKYDSGMYIFLQCPSISSFEWHPFSITSAPGDQHLSVHIRALGDWTHEMARVFKEALEQSEKKNSPLKGHDQDNEHDPRFPKLFIDGPYGAPAQDYKKYEVMLLIGVGIGATPFISVVRDVLNHLRLAELNLDSRYDSSMSSVASDYSTSSNGSSDSSPIMVAGSSSSSSCSPLHMMISSSNNNSPYYSPSPNRWSKKSRHRSAPPTQAYFYWITREQGSFEWFKGVMNEVAEIDQKAVIELHNYLTSVYEEGDARSALITLVQALQHAKNGLDILSGTRVRTHFARPNWRKVFSRVAANHPNARIGVFYCGPSGLSKELSSLCKKFSQSSHAKFEFHKENF